MGRKHTVIQFFIGMVSLVSHTTHQPVHRVGVSYYELPVHVWLSHPLRLELSRIRPRDALISHT